MSVWLTCSHFLLLFDTVCMHVCVCCLLYLWCSTWYSTAIGLLTNRYLLSLSACVCLYASTNTHIYVGVGVCSDLWFHIRYVSHAVEFFSYHHLSGFPLSLVCKNTVFHVAKMHSHSQLWGSPAAYLTKRFFSRFMTSQSCFFNSLKEVPSTWAVSGCFLSLSCSGHSKAFCVGVSSGAYGGQVIWCSIIVYNRKKKKKIFCCV